MSLSDSELRNIFDFLELKRGEKLGCSICGANDWAGRKADNDERNGAAITRTYVQLICKNCKHVVWFTDKVLDGPW